MVTIALVVALQAALPPQDASRLTLSQAVDRAIASHPSVTAARAGRDRAAAEAGDARASRLPRFSLDASFTQFQEPMVVLPLHGFDPLNPPLFDRSLVQSGVSGAWTVYDFGQRTARVRVQDALGAAAAAAVTSAERQLIARTAGAYVRVLTARGVLAAHDERLTALAAAGARVRQLVSEGKAARIEQLRVVAETKRAEADRIATAAQLDVAEQELAQLAALPVTTVRRTGFGALHAGDSSYAVDTSDAFRAGLVARAVRASSEVDELENRSRAAGAGLSAARSLRFPEVRASGAFLDRGRLRGDFAGEWQVGMAVSYPLYTGGSRAYAIGRASAEEQAATAQVRIAQLNIESAIDRGLAAIREAHARAVALQSAVEQSAEVARIEQLSIDVGSGTQTQYLDAQANLLRVRASLIEAQHAEISSRIELARVAGELSREWLARTIELR